MFRLSNINWGDRDTVKRLVFRDGLKLQLASTELKKDFDIVMLAVKQNENAILFADPSLLDNPDFFKYVLIKRGSLFNYSSKNKILSAATDKVKNNKGLMQLELLLPALIYSLQQPLPRNVRPKQHRTKLRPW